MTENSTRGGVATHLGGACSFESRCKLIIRADVLVALAIEIILGLGTFSFKDQPIKVRRGVRAPLAPFSYEFAELECTLRIIKQIARIMQKCKSTFRGSSESQGERSVAYVRLFTLPRYLVPFSRETLRSLFA